MHSVRLRIVMTCDNQSMLCNMRCQRECRVKSTLCTQGQEQRRLTVQKELKAGMKNDLKTAWIYPRPSGSTAPPQHTTPHEPHGVVGVILSPSIIRSTCSFKLICSSPGFPVLNHAFPSPFPGTSFRQSTNPPHHTVNASSRQASPDHLCCVRLHVSQGSSSFQRCVLLNSGCLFVTI